MNEDEVRVTPGGSIFGTITPEEFLRGKVLKCPDCEERFYNERFLVEHHRLKH